MLSFLAILPRSLVTFFYAAAALLRFYGNAETIPLERYGLEYTILDWSLVAFIAATVLLLVAIGIEWHGGSRRKYQEAEAREREARRDALAEREAGRAEEERRRAARRAGIQARFIVLQVRHQLENSPETRAALRDFVALLEEYGEF